MDWMQSQKVTELKNDAQLLTCGALLIQNSHSELVMVAKSRIILVNIRILYSLMEIIDSFVKHNIIFLSHTFTHTHTHHCINHQYKYEFPVRQ